MAYAGNPAIRLGHDVQTPHGIRRVVAIGSGGVTTSAGVDSEDEHWKWGEVSPLKGVSMTVFTNGDRVTRKNLDFRKHGTIVGTHPNGQVEVHWDGQPHFWYDSINSLEHVSNGETLQERAEKAEARVKQLERTLESLRVNFAAARATTTTAALWTAMSLASKLVENALNPPAEKSAPADN